MVFEHLDEVQHFFQEYGGVIYRIEKYIDTDEDMETLEAQGKTGMMILQIRLILMNHKYFN